MIACLRNRINAAETLICADADMDVKSPNGPTALMLEANSGFWKLSNFSYKTKLWSQLNQSGLDSIGSCIESQLVGCSEFFKIKKERLAGAVYHWFSDDKQQQSSRTHTPFLQDLTPLTCDCRVKVQSRSSYNIEMIQFAFYYYLSILNKKTFNHSSSVSFSYFHFVSDRKNQSRSLTTSYDCCRRTRTGLCWRLVSSVSLFNRSFWISVAIASTLQTLKMMRLVEHRYGNHGRRCW